MNDWVDILVAAGGETTVAAAGMFLTRLDSWYYALRKPSWQPPDWLFGPAWTLIFIGATTAAVIGWRATHGATALLLVVLFVINGALNMVWSYFFFIRRRPDWSIREIPFLWLSIAAPMLVLALHAGWAWIFLAPYLLWVSFAGVLNNKIVQLNKPFGGPA
jgi:tryptophan-rich sensory protein